MTREEVRETFRDKNDIELKLKTKKSEKRMYELNLAGIEETIDAKITASYEEYIKANSINDSTSLIGIRRVERKREYTEKIEQLEKEIAQLEYMLNCIIEKLKILSYKEKVLLNAKYVDRLQDYEIGNITYLRYFNQTRDERTIQRIIEKALKKMENIA